MVQFKRDKTQNSEKLPYDKYYTDVEVARRLIDLTYDIIGKENISEIIEPSAGGGAFSHQIPGCIAYDIKPEGEGIIEADYLSLDIEYKPGRLFIGNPPFGDRLIIARHFMKNHYKQGDYIAYILPISQIDNNFNFYEFDLIYSKDLGMLKYSNRDIHCCFNIYVRPEGGLNKRKDLYILPDTIRIEERKIVKGEVVRGEGYTGTPDFRICSWGASAGRLLEDGEQYAKELGFYIDDSIKDEFEKFINDFKYEDLKGTSKNVSSPNIVIWRMKQHILENFLKENDTRCIKDI